MGVVVTVDPQSPVPPFEQVRAQLARDISHGRLTVGERLPPVRRLAADVGLAVNTVARAYRELEEAGLVETRGRGGTIVRSDDAARRQLQAAAGNYALLARAAGVDDQEAVRIVTAALTRDGTGG